MKKNHSIVSLMGGLGNQLFQYSFALNLHQQGDVILTPLLSNVRNNYQSEPELCSLELHPEVRVKAMTSPVNRVTQKLLNTGLRLSTRSLGARLVPLVEHSLFYEQFPPARIAHGLGFPGRDFIVEKNRTYVGYFQTFRFAAEEKTFPQLMQLRPRRFDGKLRAAIDSIKNQRAIMVHVRLTDYLSEPRIGVPSVSYYKNAIEKAFNQWGECALWVFSDDINLAEKYLPIEFQRHYKFFSSLETTVDNFELMRHFSGYIIANSTFSWWAAFLRYDQNASVYCPRPWFSDGTTPIDLFPSKWIQLDAFT